jgi:hypothetical protein
MTLEKFCKIWDTEDIGQIVAMLTRNSEGDPAIQFFAQPPELGVCMIGIGYKDTDDGWDQAEKRFAELSEEQARTAVKVIFDAVC